MQAIAVPATPFLCFLARVCLAAPAGASGGLKFVRSHQSLHYQGTVMTLPICSRQLHQILQECSSWTDFAASQAARGPEAVLSCLLCVHACESLLCTSAAPGWKSKPVMSVPARLAFCVLSLPHRLDVGAPVCLQHHSTMHMLAAAAPCWCQDKLGCR